MLIRLAVFEQILDTTKLESAHEWLFLFNLCLREACDCTEKNPLVFRTRLIIVWVREHSIFIQGFFHEFTLVNLESKIFMTHTMISMQPYMDSLKSWISRAALTLDFCKYYF